MSKHPTPPIPEIVSFMIANPGLYFGGDSVSETAVVPIWSHNGHLFSMKLDMCLHPLKFTPGFKLMGGPFVPNSP